MPVLPVRAIIALIAVIPRLLLAIRLLAVLLLRPILTLVAIAFLATRLITLLLLGLLLLRRIIVAALVVIAVAIVIIAVIIDILAARPALLVELRAAFAEHAEIMIGELQPIFGLHPVTGEL